MGVDSGCRLSLCGTVWKNGRGGDSFVKIIYNLIGLSFYR